MTGKNRSSSRHRLWPSSESKKVEPFPQSNHKGIIDDFGGGSGCVPDSMPSRKEFVSVLAHFLFEEFKNVPGKHPPHKPKDKAYRRQILTKLEWKKEKAN